MTTRKDYGKSLRWPNPPLVLRSAVKHLKSIHERWRAWMVIKRIPQNEWPQARLKVIIGYSNFENSLQSVFCVCEQITACEALCKKRHEYGLMRRWEGNYLALNNENSDSIVYNQTIKNIKNKDKFDTVS